MADGCIAVFSTAWNGEPIGGILAGMREKVKETGDALYIFNSYGGFEAEPEYNDCEYNIFNLPFSTQRKISNAMQGSQGRQKLRGLFLKGCVSCFQKKPVMVERLLG